MKVNTKILCPSLYTCDGQLPQMCGDWGVEKGGWMPEWKREWPNRRPQFFSNFKADLPCLIYAPRFLRVKSWALRILCGGSVFCYSVRDDALPMRPGVLLCSITKQISWVGWWWMESNNYLSSRTFFPRVNISFFEVSMRLSLSRSSQSLSAIRTRLLSS